MGSNPLSNIFYIFMKKIIPGSQLVECIPWIYYIFACFPILFYMDNLLYYKHYIPILPLFSCYLSLINKNILLIFYILLFCFIILFYMDPWLFIILLFSYNPIEQFITLVSFLYILFTVLYCFIVLPFIVLFFIVIWYFIGQWIGLLMW